MTCTTSPESQFAAMADLLAIVGATASSCGMDAALTAATAWTERYILNGQAGSIKRQVYGELLAGLGSQRLMLSMTPVRAIGRVFNGSDTGTSNAYCSTDLRLENAAAGFLELTSNIGFDWNAIGTWDLTYAPRATQVWRPWYVTYEAGWIFACSSSTSSAWLTTTTGRTLPEDVERAVLLKAAEFWQGSVTGVERMKVGPLELNLSSASLDPVVELLAPYRRL